MNAGERRLVVIGGSDAGISAALRAREVDGEARITVVVADRFPNFSICGIPFFLSGEVSDWKDLAHRTSADIEKEGVELSLEHRANTIDLADKRVTVSTPSGELRVLSYDRLVIATGATSARPPIQGLGLQGVFFIRWMKDAFAVKQWLADRRPSTALVVGGGYIGMEMADALSRLGIAVTVVEYAPSLLQTVDADLAELVRAELEQQDVKVVTGVGIESLSRDGERLAATGSGGFRRSADLVVVAGGATPESTLARASGIEIGVKGAIRVDRSMATSARDVFAAGDCAETYHRLLDGNVYLPLGTTAHRQGRVAGENAAGGSRQYAGSLGTQVVKVFGLVVGRTGLREPEARAAGYDPLTVDSETWDHKVYYPGATRMKIRLTGDRRSGKLLGAQVLGRHGAEVSKRVDLFAAALFHRMKVADLEELDLSYTPPLSSPFDPVQMSAQQWLQQPGREGEDEVAAIGGLVVTVGERRKNMSERQSADEVLRKAFDFHGHKCWASTAGVRAGLAALRALGVERTGNASELHCLVEIGDNHGAQCFADGIQYATGCTLGKFNIEKTGWGKLAITLVDKKKQRSVRVAYKGTHQKRIAESAFMRKRGQGIPPTQIPEQEAWEMVNIVWKAPESDVLAIGDVKPHPFNDYGEVMGLHPCAECGELTSVAYLRVVGERHVCIPCSGYSD